MSVCPRIIVRFYRTIAGADLRYCATVRWLGRDWLSAEGAVPRVRATKVPQAELEERYRVAINGHQADWREGGVAG